MADNELHLWHINLLPYLQLDANDSLLNEAEKTRKNRYVFETHQQRFGACRKILKLILATYLKVDAATLVIETAEHGKPYLAGNPLKFNLSHSHDSMFLGISTHSEVGVDIEQIKTREFLGIARHSFSALETSVVLKASDSEKANRFYRIWCQKEAFIKLDGRGLGYPLKDFSVSALDAGGLVECLDETLQTVSLTCYQSASNLFAAYCMNLPEVNAVFFNALDLDNVISSSIFQPV